MKYILSSILCLLVFSACSTKEPLKTKSLLITIKTPNIKYSDMGFLKTYTNSNELEIYSFGRAIFYLKVYENRICTSPMACKSSQNFIKEYFHKNYPSTFLYEVLNQKELTNMDGFNYIYKKENEIYFKDKENSIFIQIKEIP